ncbi:MAG TPA: DNA polymerase III subunit delta' [Methylophilaceae bacterium]|nr:DNA polymerase III subunit delta' [Methylophilaceae bacterium]
MIINNFYPWHESLRQSIIIQKNRLPHALLLHGRIGTGKFDFANLLSKSLLCDQPVQGLACHTCAKCLWFEEGHHPDFKLITPEELVQNEESSKKKTNKKTQISVDQIRQLIQALNLTNHGTHSLRIVLIHPAEALNLASANALLKILEEPPNNTVFMLVCHQVQRLLPTIMSRCQAIAMPVPEKDVALNWLKMQHVSEPEVMLEYFGGAPLNVLDVHESMRLSQDLFKQLGLGAQLDIFSCVPLLIECGMEQAVLILQKWTYDLWLSLYSIQQHYHSRHGRALQGLAKSVNLALLMDFQRQLIEAKQTANHPLSQELQLESLLLSYKKVFVRSH